MPKMEFKTDTNPITHRNVYPLDSGGCAEVIVYSTGVVRVNYYADAETNHYYRTSKVFEDPNTPLLDEIK